MADSVSVRYEQPLLPFLELLPGSPGHLPFSALGHILICMEKDGHFTEARQSSSSMLLLCLELKSEGSGLDMMLNWLKYLKTGPGTEAK